MRASLVRTVRPIGEYVLVLGIGTWLLMVLSVLVGYLPYASPGWQTMTVSQRLEGVGFVSRFVVGTLLPLAFVAGVVLCLLGWSLRAFRARSWVMAVIGGIISAVVSGYLLLGLAWYIEMAKWPVLTGLLLGGAFGATRIPRAFGRQAS